MINTLLFHVAVIIFAVHSQECAVENQSPNNPANANCTTFFDVFGDILSDCLCCVPNVDDNPADECLVNPVKTVTGLAECSENFDCCACEEIVCNDCVDIKCNGDSSCIGVPFTITGSSGGATIDCNGDVSAFRAVFEGTNIKEVVCSGDNACEEASFIFSCISDGCKLNFGGDGIVRDIDNIFANVTNVAELSCSGDEVCYNSIFDLDCISTGCPIRIGGPSAGLNSTFIVSQASAISCSASQSCSGATINADCISSGCAISCSAGCPGAEVNVVNSNGLSCEGTITFEDNAITIGACEDGIFILDNNVGESLFCSGVKSCKNGIFSGSDGTKITNIGGISCTNTESCLNAVINAECDSENGCEFGCDGANACSATSDDKIFNITNVASVGCDGGIAGQPVCGNRTFILEPVSTNFQIGCSGSCIGSIFDVATDLASIKGIECSSAFACDDTTFEIDSSISSGFTIEEIKCGAGSACINSMFNIIAVGDLTVSKFECGDSFSCSGINVSIDLVSVSNGLTIEFVCGGSDSCSNAVVTISRAGIPLSGTAVQALGITISCGGAGSCNGAQINGVPFTDF